MNSNKLPIEIPLISGYKFHAIPLAILSINPANLPWIFNNYLQLFVRDFPDDSHWLDFYISYNIEYLSDLPWLKNNFALRYDDTLFNTIDFDFFIRANIDARKYIYLYGDGFYLDHHFAYRKFHDSSHILIFGYNRDEDYWDALDYSYSTRRQFEPMKIACKDLKTAYFSENNRKIIHAPEYNETFRFSFNLELAIRLLSDYLSAKNSFRSVPNTTFTKETAFGVDVYGYLIKLCERELTESKNRLSLLPFHTLLEHKICLAHLVPYAMNAGIARSDSSVSEAAGNLVTNARILKNQVIKFKMNNNLQIIDSIMSRAEQLRESEKPIISYMIAEFQRTLSEGKPQRV